MNIDQRLHRAAHELREIEITVPPLAPGPATKATASKRQFAAVVAAAALAAFGGVMTLADTTPDSTAAEQVTVDAGEGPLVESPAPAERAEAVEQLSALEELAMITALPERAARDGRVATTDSAVPPGAS